MFLSLFHKNTLPAGLSGKEGKYRANYGLSPIPPSRVKVSPVIYLKSGEAS